jgi:hypothetical protein
MLQATTTRVPSITTIAPVLLKADRPRAIDAIIDYFGTGQRPASSVPVIAMPAKEAV